MTKFDKGIPIPKGRGTTGSGLYVGMEVGDSFFRPLPDGLTMEKHQTRTINSASSWGRRQSPRQKFTTRAVEENGVKGIRVWRIE